MSDAWTGLPGFAALTGFGGGSPDGAAVMAAGLDAVSNGSTGELLSAFLADTTYVDFNFSYSFGAELKYLGFTGGVQVTNSGYYPFFGGGFIYPSGSGEAATIGSGATPGLQFGLQFGGGGLSAQGGYALGSGWFGEGGVGTFGVALTGYYVFGPFNY